MTSRPQSLPYRGWGNGRLWSPSLYKRIESSGNKIEGRVISACIRPSPHYMYHLQVYIGLKTQKSYFSDAAERNNNLKYACAHWQDRPCPQGLLISQYGCGRTRPTQGCPWRPYNVSISSGAHNSPVEFQVKAGMADGEVITFPKWSRVCNISYISLLYV